MSIMNFTMSGGPENDGATKVLEEALLAHGEYGDGADVEVRDRLIGEALAMSTEAQPAGQVARTSLTHMLVGALSDVAQVVDEFFFRGIVETSMELAESAPAQAAVAKAYHHAGVITELPPGYGDVLAEVAGSRPSGGVPMTPTDVLQVLDVLACLRDSATEM